MNGSSFSRAILRHVLARVLSGIEQLSGAVLRALAEAQPPVFDGSNQSPLVLDLLELNATLNRWHERLSRRRETLNADLRLMEGKRR